MIKGSVDRKSRQAVPLNRRKLVYSADDASPSITTIPVTSVDAAVQFRDSDKSGSVLVLGNQRSCFAIDLLITLLHDHPALALVGHDRIGSTALSR